MKEITLVLVRGEATRAVTPEDLAHALRADPAALHGAFLGLLLSRQRETSSPEIGSGEGEGGGAIDRTVDGSLKPTIDGSPDRTIVGPQGNISARSDRSNDRAPDIFSSPANDRSSSLVLKASPKNPGALAKYLADELGDPGGLPWYQTVAATLDRQIITATLYKTMSIPTAQIRTTRGAYFTALVVPLIRHARMNHPHATSTPTPP
jgi:hypothetical protein